MAEEVKEVKIAEPKQKISVDLEVDTSIKDLGVNPYAKLIHMARAVDAWRIFPRLFLTVYIILLYKCVIWYMDLPGTYYGTKWVNQYRCWCWGCLVWSIYRNK